MEHTYLAHFYLMLYSSTQNRRWFASPSNNDRVDQPTPSCGPPSVEHPSTSSPQKVTSAWTSLLCFPLEMLTFWDNSVTKSPSVTTSSIIMLMYEDSRFARHPHFRFFAEMRWHALQTERNYIRQHPGKYFFG